MCEVVDVEPLERVCMTRGFFSDEWLSDNELEYLNSLHDKKRRTQSRAARWLIKETIAVTLGYKDWRSVEICSVNGQGKQFRPMIIVEGQSKPWKCSISHTDHHVAVGFNSDVNCPIGVDLVSKNDLENLKLKAWMTPSEKSWVEQSSNPSRFYGLFWGIKEAAYKSSNRGESFHPLSFEVVPQNEKDFRIRTMHEKDELEKRAFVQWSENDEYFLVTVDLMESKCGVSK